MFLDEPFQECNISPLACDPQRGGPRRGEPRLVTVGEPVNRGVLPSGAVWLLLAVFGPVYSAKYQFEEVGVTSNGGRPYYVTSQLGQVAEAVLAFHQFLEYLAPGWVFKRLLLSCRHSQKNLDENHPQPSQ